MKILFIGNSRLGDAILSTPILNYYNKKKNNITVICSPLSKEIYSSFISVDKIIILKKRKRGLHWLQAYILLEPIKWDLIIDLRNSILSRLIRKNQILRSTRNNIKSHKVDDYCKLIKLKTNKDPSIPPNAFIQSSIKDFIKKKNIRMPILAVAPITNWKRKDWPLNNYKNLINKLLKHEKIFFSSVILLGSKNEKYKCERLKKSLKISNIYNLAGSLKILEIFELLKLCKFFLGNDSGLTHLAAASNIKTLALFGPSRDENYRPWGKNSYFIRTPETYSQLVEVKGYSRFENSSLMKTLTVEEVLKTSMKIISNKT